jgi:hypothetical protein
MTDAGIDLAAEGVPVVLEQKTTILWKCHIPSDLVVDPCDSDGESSSHRGFLFLQDICTASNRPSS